MSSRPSMGVPQRQPPSRSMSGSGSLSQKSTHQRSLSSQHQPHLPPSSPTVRTNAAEASASTDAASQSSSVAQAQYGTPRRGGSRLRLELANDGITHSGFVESPTNTGPLDPSKPFTPSRVMAPGMTDAPELGEMSSPRTSRGGQTADNDNPPLPMPRRRCRFAMPDAKKTMPVQAPAPVKKDIKSKPQPYSIEVPAVAPRYLVLSGGSKDSQARSGSSNAPPVAYADFTPWKGDGPEDHFTQNFIQSGCFDKAPAGQTETGTAKSAIFPSLKHKTGLYALSTVFTGLLASRRHNGQITSPSTFKAPPRVTVTDAKREGWLKDLANPNTSLRRLSRTVPHGIRGKGLLEQCLNKNIPIDRAVWLAKCVGANEIRAFKRKGVNGAVIMGGEAKWIRDWTVFIEQFVDGVVSSFGDSEWKVKVNYAIRLATFLYAEHLMDREHYMEWLVSGLEDCSQAKLPMYLLIIQIYWKDLLQLRKYGRRLVTALLNQHTMIHSHPDSDIFAPLTSRLLMLIKSLMTSTAINFVSPSTWPKHKEALLSALPQDDEAIQAAYQAINLRNEQLLSSVRTPSAARNGWVKTLDGVLQTPISDDLPLKSWSASNDQDAFVKAMLEWCTSIYRPGVAKVYVTHRLLSTWASLGLDTTGAILEFLASDALEELDRKAALYHLVSQLVLSGHFDSMRYVQWLIARGGIRGQDGIAPDGPAISRLLVELPVPALPDSLRTMRSNMLGRASYSVDEEIIDTGRAIEHVKNSLGLHWATTAPASKPIPIAKLCKLIRKSSRALKTEIGICLKHTLIQDMVQSQNAGKEGIGFPTSTFTAVRSILEAAEDFQTLADFLKAASGSFDADILSSCTDTTNFHLPVFGALGVVKDLFNTLVAKLGNLTQSQGIVAARPLVTSMAMLAPRISGQENLVNQLNETIRNDRYSAVDASSPVSDNMAARIQDEEGELLDEIEKRLANKTSMDRTTMNSFLNKIIPKIHVCWGKADERLRAYGTLLTRLRHFDVAHFDSFITKWILGIRNPQSRPPLSQIFPLLVSVGCLSFSVILATASDAVSATARSNSSSKAPGTRPSTYVQEVLELLTAPPAAKDILTPEEIYRFTIKQNQAPKTHFKEMVSLVRNAMAEYCTSLGQESSQSVPLADSCSRQRLINLLRTLVLTDQSAVPKLLSPRAADPALGDMMDDITTRLLLPNGPPGVQITFDKVLGLVNEFNLPFCQLKLQQCFASGETTGNNPQERLQSQLEVYSKAIDNAIDSRNITWTSILPWLAPEVIQHLLNRAQTRLFDLLPSMKAPTTPVGSFAVAETLLSIIDTITRGGPVGSRSSSQPAPATVDRLADLWELLASPSDVCVKVDIILHWLPLMLSLLSLSADSHDPNNKQSNEIRGRSILVLSGLLQELEGLTSLAMSEPLIRSQQVAHLSQRILDLALVLVDGLTDEARQQCIRHLRDALSDSRLRYIFSFAPAPLDNLMLSQKEKQSTTTQRRGMGFLGVGTLSANVWGVPVPAGGVTGERLSNFSFRRWEILNEPTPNMGDNVTSLSLTLFEGIKLQ